MGPIDFAWHVLNFLAPAVGLGMVSALLVKLAWRRELAGVSWLRLARWASSASVLALVAGLVITGREGRMVTYAAMVFGCALALGWAGFGATRR